MSIIRHVYIRLKPEHQNRAGRDALIDASKALAAVPGVRGLSVLGPADEPAGAAWDLCLVLRFDDLAAVEVYREHPDHRRYVDEFLLERLAVLKAWNFEAVDTP